MQLQIAVRHFLDSRIALGRKPRTIDSYRQRLGQMACHFGLATPLDSITPLEVNGYAVMLRTAKERHAGNKYRHTQEGGLSEASVCSRLRDCRAFFGWCVKMGLITQNPAGHIPWRNPIPKAKKNMMTPEDFDRCHQYASHVVVNDGDWLAVRNAAVWLWLADTAARLGETASLAAVGELVRDGVYGCDVVGKTGERRVYYSEPTHAAINRYLELCPHPASGSLWIGFNGGGLGCSGIYQGVCDVGRAAGATGKINPHAIRHYNGYRYARDHNLALSQRKLGHADITTTGRYYAHHDDDEVAEATGSY